jgi:cardiolipin synthase C
VNVRGLMRIAAGLGLALLLGACASLPEGVERPTSTAIVNDGTTALARIAAVGRPAAPELSGFRLLPTGDYAFRARLELARRAEKSLDVQYYLLKNDAVGRRFLRELRDAATRGVRVRLLVDDFYAGGEEELFASLAAWPNVEIRLFNPLPVRGSSPLMRLLLSYREFERINHRMHNKLFIADNALSISGGRNIADEYFMVSGEANFIDIDALSSGPVVTQLSAVFDDYWNSEHVYPVGSLVRLPLTPEAARRRFDELVAGADPALPNYERDPFGITPVETQIAAGRLQQVFAEARVFADSPNKVADKLSGQPSAMMRNTLAVIGGAENEVVLVSPYFIPGEVGMPMMRAASRKGIRTLLFTNALGATDEPLVHARYVRYRKEMLKLGVEIYEISPTLTRDSFGFGNFGRSLGRLHGKVAVVDKRFVFVGSMNLDGRSAIANTELGLVIDSAQMAAGFATLMGRDAYRSMYRLRLAANGEDIEWVATDREGRDVVYKEEPDDSWLLRLKLWLLSPFAAEELL